MKTIGILATVIVTAGLLLAAWPGVVPAAAPPQPEQGTTYYVRTDGGTPDQCTGLADAPYPGSGPGQPCAWDHPFRALPPDGTARISGGDTLVIAAGSYMIGYGAPGADACDPDGAFDCTMLPVPSGLDVDHRTRIVGAGWDQGCPNPQVQLWGTQRVDYLIDLTGASNVEVACLELTDHSGCIEFHPDASLTCERDTYPFGDWAATGLYAEDSTNVLLRYLNIHGFAHGGVWAGRLTDWTVEHVRIAGNGWVGWDGDIDGDDANSGTLAFRHLSVEWSGCGEPYPDAQPTGCWAQTAGGYGDGFGTGETGGHWIFEDSVFQFNTSDGLDLLYTRQDPSLIEIRRTIARNNAGNQIKTTGPTVIENSVLAGGCGFFEGQPFTYNVDACRAGGDTLALDLRPGNQASLVNSTLTGEGTCLIISSCADNACTGAEHVEVQNSVFVGRPRFFSPGEDACFAWYDDEPPDNVLPTNPFAVDYAVITGTVFGNVTPDCSGAHNQCDADPRLGDPALYSFDGHLFPDSPAIDAGNNAFCPGPDLDGRPRPVDGDGDGTPVCDIGAYEWAPIAPSTAAVYLPAVFRGYTASTGPTATLILDDDFNDGTLTGWTPNYGTWTNPGDHMRGEYATGNAWNIHSATGSDIIYEGTVTLESGNAVGLVFRSSADGTSSYDVILDAVDDVFKISKRAPYEILASYTVTVQYNQPYTIKVVASGSTIDAYLDGVQRLAVTDGTYGSGHLGVMLFLATATYDDLRAWEVP
jgi:hypothetical protein